MGLGSALFFGFLGIIFAISVIGIGIYGYYISYQYDKEIGSYMENAVDMIAPEGMLEQVELAKQGMINAGLNEEDYGAWIFKKPSNSMKFQYQHIEGIIERIKAVQDWKNKMALNGTQIETLGDVYEQKMTNLRNYIKEGGIRSDWIAKDTWYLKYHFVYAKFGGWISVSLGFLSLACFLLAGGLYDN